MATTEDLHRATSVGSVIPSIKGKKHIPQSDALWFTKITRVILSVCASSNHPSSFITLTFESPILTYSNRGTAKPGVKPEHHAIIYTESKSSKYPPSELRGERPLINTPICVELTSAKHKLARESRINYAKVYTVEHNNKVSFIGKIHSDSQDAFKKAYHKVQRDTDSPTQSVVGNEMPRNIEATITEDGGGDGDGNLHPDNRNFKY